MTKNLHVFNLFSTDQDGNQQWSGWIGCADPACQTDLMSDESEETYLQEGCVSLPIYCSSTGFCTFFFALICFSVLNAAETAPRVWFQGWVPNTCTKCTTEFVWGVWVELRCLPRGGHLSNTGLDRQSDFNWPVQLLALVGSSWLYYVSGAYLSKSFLAQKSSLSEAVDGVEAGVYQQILDALCSGGIWCLPHLHRLSVTILYSFFLY